MRRERAIGREKDEERITIREPTSGLGMIPVRREHQSDDGIHYSRKNKERVLRAKVSEQM